MKKSKFKVICTNLIIVCMLSVLFYVTNLNSISQPVSNNYKQPIYRGNTENKNISLMINVYWGTEFIEDILKVLDKYNFKITFFVGGSWVEKNITLLKKIDSKGHEIANHGYLHKDHKKLNYQCNYDEIVMTNKLVKNILGKDITLFAPPSGSFSNITLKVAEELNLTTIMWSKDTIDWRDKDSNLVYKRATKNIQNGDLILAHPTKHTLEALDKIFAYYIDSGYKVVPVSENIA